MLRRIMQNSEAVHFGIAAIEKCLEAEPNTIGTRSELQKAKELLHQMKKSEEIRQFERCGSEAEEELYDSMSLKRWNEIPELADRTELKQLVRRYGTQENIAAHLGCSSSSVKTALNRHGLKTIPAFLSKSGIRPDRNPRRCRNVG